MLALALAAALVAADPPQTGEPSSVAAAGDVVAFGYDQRIEAFAAGARVRIAGDDPAVAAASDGTAIVASKTRGNLVARIRRAGTGFAKTVRLGGNSHDYHVAAAPGGWSAAAWVNPIPPRVEAAVIDPAGKVRHRVLARGKDLDVSSPQIGIDGRGQATVAWVFVRHRTSRVTVVRTVAGRDWTRKDGAVARALGLAVSPSGHILLAWTTPSGMRASLDDGSPRTLAEVPLPTPPTVSLADDGSALIAYAAQEKVFALDRTPAGTWSAPQAIGEEADLELATTLAADGRAFVAWTSFPGAVIAVRAGGTWTPGQIVSSPVRLADPPVVGLDAAGNPFALWHEFEQSTFTGRIHGAKLADAPSTDTTAPTLTARLPESVTVAKSGAFSFSIPVACDEACDVRIDVGPTRPDLPGYDLRELSLPAGGHATVRISPSANDERRFVKAERPTHMHILVQAADRAGNLARAEVTARVQRR
jgi:hypothetical protein